jgi:hypothetical protein
MWFILRCCQYRTKSVDGRVTNDIGLIEVVPDNCLEGLRKPTWNQNEGRWYTDRDSNWTPSEYKLEHCRYSILLRQSRSNWKEYGSFLRFFPVLYKFRSSRRFPLPWWLFLLRLYPSSHARWHAPNYSDWPKVSNILTQIIYACSVQSPYLFIQ